MLLTQNMNLNAQSLSRIFNQSQTRANQSMERLASAKRVNHAGDDVAALGIHTRLEKQVRSASKEREGLQNEISFAQTAEGVIQETTLQLMKLREMAVKASNSTLSEQDRKSMQSEALEHLHTIGELKNTTFNDKKIFDQFYSFSNGNNRQITSNFTKLKSLKLETHETISKSIHRSQRALNAYVPIKEGGLKLGQMKTRVNNNGFLEVLEGVNVRATQASDDTLSSEHNDGSAIAKAAAINSGTSEHGVTATVEATTATLAVSSGMFIEENLNFEINGINLAKESSFSFTAGDINGTLVQRINEYQEQTGVRAEVLSGHRIQLTAEDGRNISVSIDNPGRANSLGFFENQRQTHSHDHKIVVGGKLTLSSDKAFSMYYDLPIMNEALGTIHADTPFNRELLSFSVDSGGDYESRSQSGPGLSRLLSLYEEDPTSPIPDGVRNVEGSVDHSKLAYLRDYYGSFMDLDDPTVKQIHHFYNSTYMDFHSYETVDDPSHPGYQEERVYARGGLRRWVTPNIYSGRPPGIFGVNSMYIKRDIRIEFDPQLMHQLDTKRTSEDPRSSAFQSTIYESIYGQFTNRIDTTPNQYYQNFQLQSFDINHTEVQVKNVDLSTQEGAVKSLGFIDTLLNELSSEQSKLGTLQTTLAHSINRVEQTQFDIAQADERIMSTDFAVEVAELTKQQIKQKLGAELLNKVNIDSTLALALVQSGGSQTKRSIY